jgi:hypothetical protein
MEGDFSGLVGFILPELPSNKLILKYFYENITSY